MNPLHEKFKGRGVIRGGTLLLDSEAAVAMIREAARLGVGILGIDAFIVTQDSTTPSMEFSRSFEVEEGAHPHSHQLAEKHVLENANKGLLFEVVIDEPDRSGT
jgi:uroporphyrinogen-III decarboxylase